MRYRHLGKYAQALLLLNESAVFGFFLFIADGRKIWLVFLQNMQEGNVQVVHINWIYYVFTLKVSTMMFNRYGKASNNFHQNNYT